MHQHVRDDPIGEILQFPFPVTSNEESGYRRKSALNLSTSASWSKWVRLFDEQTFGEAFRTFTHIWIQRHCHTYDHSDIQHRCAQLRSLFSKLSCRLHPLGWSCDYLWERRLQITDDGTVHCTARSLRTHSRKISGVPLHFYLINPSHSTLRRNLEAATALSKLNKKLDNLAAKIKSF